MTRLSACYFCGTALDEPLEDYPVVPEPLRTGDPTTVTLCPSCHEKLDAVLERVTDAVDEAGVVSADVGSSPDASSRPPDADPDEVLVDPEPTVASDDPIVDDPETAADPADSSPAERDSEPGAAADSDREPGTEADSDREPGTEADSGQAGDADESGAETASDDAGERSVVEGKHDISALEYNKVMRLLQNREFPVDREEIEMVAANAYQVARADCEQVIDVAIDRGLIEEVDGQLREPENA